MSSKRLAFALLGMTAAALVAALPASGKEGVRATLTTSIPLHAPAGTRLQIAWTLAYRDEHGRRQPFGAGGGFVRIRSASGAGAKTGFARGSAGEYTATVLVPKGGIGRVEIGIHSWTNGPTGTHRSDWLVPITNDPMARPGSERSGSASSTWIFLLAAGSLATLAAFAVALVRRRNLGQAGGSDIPAR